MTIRSEGMIKLFLILLFISCSHTSVVREPSSLNLVASLPQLYDALERAQSGETILLDSNASFDFTHQPTLVIDKTITIKSVATNPFKRKAYFFSKGKPAPLMRITAANVVISGLKIEGYEKDTKKVEIEKLNAQGIKGVYQFPITRGIEIKNHGVKIENCEIFGFSHAAIALENSKNVIIEHNHIHHNQRLGLGYGVVLSGQSQANIVHNIFDYNRHSVAGTGHSGQSYSANHNNFGPNHTHSTLDMHGGADRKDGTQIAGKRVEIRDNIVESKDVPVFVHRGVAEEGVYIYRNTIYRKKKKSIGYYNVTEKDVPKHKFKFYDNNFK
jgi:hypothetical protein